MEPGEWVNTRISPVRSPESRPPPLDPTSPKRPGLACNASPGVRTSQTIDSPSHRLHGAESGLCRTTGLLPDLYRVADCHYRISPRFLAIDREALQSGRKRVESQSVTGFTRLSDCHWRPLRNAEVEGSIPFRSTLTNHRPQPAADRQPGSRAPRPGAAALAHVWGGAT